MVLLLALAACGGNSSSDGSDAAKSSSAARDSAGFTGRGQEALPREVAPLAEIERGEWSGLIGLPIVPAAAAQLPTGKVLLWGSSSKFSVGPGGSTFTAEFDPISLQATERRVQETGHDMYCAGSTHLGDGSILIAGGDRSEKSSLFDPATGRWVASDIMTSARCHVSQTLLPSGEVLAVGGGYGDTSPDQYAEVWTAGSGWRRLSHLAFDSSRTEGLTGLDAGEKNPWLLTSPQGRVLRVGPGSGMSWIDPRGRGKLTFGGLRADDDLAQRGNAVMVDTGRVLKIGGAPSRQEPGSRSAYLIDMNAGLSIRRLSPMTYPRVNANSVVLPNGQVLVVGGQTVGKPLSDDLAVLPAELWDPVTERFTTLAPMSVARNDNSVAILLPDARVLTAGGGLCGSACGANHADGQIYTPYYLLNRDGTPAQRPVIQAAPSKATHGTTLTVSVDSAVSAFSLVRLSTSAHGVNNDQRRIAVRFSAGSDGQYQLSLPSNPAVLLPGQYMLFAMNERGVPSVARWIQISGADAPQLSLLDTQISSVSSPVRVAVEARSAKGRVRYAAEGLPQGLSIDPDSGVISGLPTSVGQFVVTVSASNAAATTSTQTLWTVQDGGPEEVSYVRLVALSSIDGGSTASIAEFNLLDGRGETIPRSAWTVTASTEETMDPGRAANAIDGDPRTAWYSQYSNLTPPHPHEFTVQLGAPRIVTGFRVMPRVDLPEGAIAQWRFETSRDGVNWHEAARGDFRDFGPVIGERTVYLNLLSQGKTALQSSTEYSADASRAVDGNVSGEFFAAASVSHTHPDQKGWWQVDLGAVKPLAAVRLWNRADCCGEQLAHLQVFVSSQDMAQRSFDQLLSDPSVWRARINGPVGRQVTLPTKASGRFVRIQRGRPGPLALAEVQVFGASINHAPVMGALAPFSHVLGRQMAAFVSAADPDGDALTFSAMGLPQGLTIDAQTGTISGRPLEVGTFPVTLRVSDVHGASTTGQVSWSIAPAPVVMLPSEVPPVRTGQEVVFEAGAVNPDGLRFQWNFGDGSAVVAPTSSPRQAHQFASPGVFLVEVKALSNSGQILGSRRFYQAVYEVSTSAAPTRSTGLLLEDRPNESARVWIVNPDNGSVSVFDAANDTRLAEIQTGEGPRLLAKAPDGRVWVTHPQSQQIIVIDPAALKVAQRMAVPSSSRPYGLAFAPDGQAAYVVLEGLNQLLRLDPLTGKTLGTLQVAEHSRYVAVSHDSQTVLVTRSATAAIPGEPNAQTAAKGEASAREVQVIAAEKLTLEASAPAREDWLPSGWAADAVFHPTRAYLFAALQPSREIAVIDPVAKTELFRFDAGRAPEALAVSGDGQRLYVNNLMDRTLGVYDLTPLVKSGELRVAQVRTVATVEVEKLSPQLLLGKQLFYDARDTRLASDGASSCASCHAEGWKPGATGATEASIRAHRELGLNEADLAALTAYVKQLAPKETVVPAATAASAKVDGLSGAYFNNPDFKGDPVLVRTEAVNFDWGTASPAEGVPADRFSVRWTGQVEAPGTGSFVLQVASDEGVRVWVDGRLVINRRKSGASAKDLSPSLKWVAGRRYAIIVEYLDRSGPANIQLLWKVPGAGAFTKIPTARLSLLNRSATDNLARGKPTRQSSTDRGGEAYRAVDGNTRGFYASGSVAQTTRAASSWWQVDLGSVRQIETVRLWPRTDCCGDRMADLELWVSTNDMAGRSVQALVADKSVRRFAVRSNGRPVSVSVSAGGRFVRVFKKSKNQLSLAEVEVLGK